MKRRGDITYGEYLAREAKKHGFVQALNKHNIKLTTAKRNFKDAGIIANAILEMSDDNLARFKTITITAFGSMKDDVIAEVFNDTHYYDRVDCCSYCDSNIIQALQGYLLKMDVIKVKGVRHRVFRENSIKISNVRG